MSYAQLFSYYFLMLLACGTKPNANSHKASLMSETVIKGIRLTFTGPDTLPLSVVLRDSPAYDGPRNFFTVSLKNESGKTKTLPFDEIRENTITKYRNPDTGAEIVDNQTPPPKFNGSVEKLAPGETKTYEAVFEYPASIATMKNKVAVLQFCAKWQSDWLRKAAYAAGSYDWNESFELCREIRIVDQ